MRNKCFREFILFWAVLSMLAAIPIFSAWMLNSYLVTTQDLIVPLILSTLTALLIAGIFFKLFLQDRLTGYVAAIFSILLLSTGYKARLGQFAQTITALNPIPNLKSWQDPLQSLLFFLLILSLSRVISQKVSLFVSSRKWSVDLPGGIGVGISVIFLLQLAPVAYTSAQEWPQFFYRPPALPALHSTAENKPDVYYIVLDRYTSQEVLSKQFGFDNSAFTGFLQNNGFSLNPDAHQNFPYTTMSIASTLTTSYQSDLIEKFSQAKAQTLEPFHDSIRYASVLQTFKAQGYTIDQLGTWYEASNQAPLATHSYQPEGLLTILGKTITLNTFSKFQLTESLFWRLIQHGFSLHSFKIISYSSLNEEQATPYKLGVLQQLASEPSGKRFIFAHFLIPHDPYYFNADGSQNTNPGSDNIGQPIKQKYVAQIQYINTQMQRLVNQINTQTQGKAVIIIQSDEGPYPSVLNQQQFDDDSVGDELATGNMLNWSDQDLRMKYGILAAYHIPEASPEAIQQGGDSVNIFRVVLNSYFGANLPYLPRCYYAYPNGRSQPFVFADITQRLTGNSNSACPKDSNFK